MIRENCTLALYEKMNKESSEHAGHCHSTATCTIQAFNELDNVY
jgi:hypothetical protein